MKVARFRFDPALRPLLQHDNRLGEFDYRFSGPQSAKHLIESVGIPHTEVGRLWAQSVPVTLAYLVQDGDGIDVAGNTAAEHPEQDEPRFVLDGHLGRLNSHLRMLGLDCLYESQFEDAELARTSVDENRMLLTRDRRLLMHKAIVRGYLVRSLDPSEQLREVVLRFALRGWIKPFQRCIRCNHLLQAVDKQQVEDRLEPLTKLYYQEFRICPACHQVYWKGSHFERMQQLIASLDKPPESHPSDGPSASVL